MNLFVCSYHQANHNRQCSYQLKNETEPFASMVEYRLPQRVCIFKKYRTRKLAQRTGSVKTWRIFPEIYYRKN